MAPLVWVIWEVRVILMLHEFDLLVTDHLMKTKQALFLHFSFSPWMWDFEMHKDSMCKQS